MEKERSSLSAGIVIRDVLLDNEKVKEITCNIIPVFSPTENLILPYVTYKRLRLDGRTAKTDPRRAESVEMEVACYASGYSESVDLAEAVRVALDHKTMSSDGLNLRSCTLVDSSETYEGDAFVQVLVFDVRV